MNTIILLAAVGTSNLAKFPAWFHIEGTEKSKTLPTKIFCRVISTVPCYPRTWLSSKSSTVELILYPGQKVPSTVLTAV